MTRSRFLTRSRFVTNVYFQIYSAGELPYKGMSVAEVKVQVMGGYRLTAPDKMPKVIRDLMEVHCFSSVAEERHTMTQVI
ncbi:hypothetical protein DICVIV_01898 [Dictyocaulus viviparus]|uniref:Serine-threonine/tyrosine-protein kinase catalytic domain-containing protein n=1 Tax=Dictyocaulus viviparus TaxID=29172 RepID=A0A0D8Y6U1_DICVI|nr:hypothetical protein DICVIV_01898 [Dictyocaulus viviparus]